MWKTGPGLTQKLSRARKVVHMLDAFVKEAVGSDKSILDSWNIAKRVRHSTSSAHTTPAGASTPAGVSTPAATTPATTPIAAAA